MIMNKRERKLREMMRNSCVYYTLREQIHDFLASYKRLKIIKNALLSPSVKKERYRVELRYFNNKYIGIRAFQSLYDFCKKDLKYRISHVK